MRYGDMITFGFQNAWKYKSLWILGFFAAGGGGFNFRLPGSSTKMDGLPTEFIDSIVSNPLIIVALVGFLLIIMAVYLVLHFIAEGGLMDAARRFRNNEPYTLGTSFSVGIANFWPLLGLGLLFFVVAIAFVIVLAAIGFIAYSIGIILFVLSLLFLLPIMLIGFFFIGMIYTVAQRKIVLEKNPVFDGISGATDLLKKNPGPMIAFFFLSLGLSIAVGIAITMVVLAVAAPFVGIWFVHHWLAILTGVPVLLIIGLLLGGYSGSALNLMATEFYFQLIGLPGAVKVADTTPPDTLSPRFE
jgi:hypothetical protein